MGVTSILSIISPFIAVHGGFLAFFILRLITGLFAGVTLPSTHNAWSHWAPPLERSKLIAFQMSGASIGLIGIYPLGAVLIDTFGWKSVFYATGTFGFVTFLNSNQTSKL